MNDITAEMIERGRGKDPRALAERRRRSAKVRQARERLTSSDTGHRGCDVGLLRAYASARIHSAVPATALIAMVAALTRYWMEGELVIIWTVLAFSSLLLCYGLAKKLERLLDDEINVVGWRSKFVAAEFLHGLVWAAMALLLLQAKDPNAKAFVTAMLMLAAAFNTMVTATIPFAVYATITPISLAIVACLRIDGMEDTSLSLLALVGAAQVFFVVLAKRVHHVTREGLFFRIEKDDLIGELEQAKANSDEARRRAEEANLAKSRFLATMSHELRTPLNAILGFSEVLKNELFGVHAVAAYKDYSNDIHSSGQHLLMLINEILDLSRVEAGRYELKEESVSLAGVVEDCRHLLTIRAQKRGIEMIEAKEPDLPRIWADERAVRQIVLNLLTNAIKFTPQGGQVTLKIGWTSAGGQYVAIRDTGPGIPEEEIAVVMSSFGRGTLAQKNAEEGTGLGLPIVKGLVDLHGGLFKLKSRVREGTEAIVVFPPERVMNALPKFEEEEEAQHYASAERRRSAAA
ncbi:sensor histidine kinase [Methylosinus sporium]|uniref:histidine kinase n=1 Tax=Methylosinus sporium TaxID=428 RepID=A0A549SPR5_METSR|nr:MULTISPECIES: ATP-binding protein [Methylosinus]MBU3889433.1 sensor histidine kinase [Methylosinus sp. KRF6]TRL31614.1 sensor histidine kinase [Methylosinus sporium]